ncbi:hypothetical protein P12x_003004 [Tundrisphaera lichenicola]|uniref:hypothetical protein n=1 Tax=Tundrisphaera lichenicola TaxID=2029860 RepID=UPI003EBD303B
MMAGPWLTTMDYYVSPILDITIVITFISAAIYSGRRVIPEAIDRWAMDHGYKILESKDAGFLKRMSFSATACQWVQIIVVQDRNGARRSGMLKVGDHWFPSLSVEQCPIEVEWDEGDEGKSSDWPEL